MGGGRTTQATLFGDVLSARWSGKNRDSIFVQTTAPTAEQGWTVNDMGQHKHNPTAQAAKSGGLPPKKRPMSKREQEAVLRAMVNGKLKLNRLYDALNVGRYWGG